MESIAWSNVLASPPHRRSRVLQGKQSLSHMWKPSYLQTVTVSCLGFPYLRMSRDSICGPQAFIAVMDDSQPKQDG